MKCYYCGSLISFACKLQDLGWVISKRHPNCQILSRLLSIFFFFCDREIVQIGARVLAILSISVRDQVDEIGNLSMPITGRGGGTTSSLGPMKDNHINALQFSWRPFWILNKQASNARSGAHTKETWTAQTIQKLSGRPIGRSLRHRH